MTRGAAGSLVWGQIGWLQVIEAQLKLPPSLGILRLLASRTLSVHAGLTLALCWPWEGTRLWAAPGSRHPGTETRKRRGTSLSECLHTHAQEALGLLVPMTFPPLDQPLWLEVGVLRLAARSTWREGRAVPRRREVDAVPTKAGKAA